MKVITNLITIIFLEVMLRLFMYTAQKFIGTIKGIAPVLWNSAMDRSKRSA